MFIVAILCAALHSHAQNNLKGLPNDRPNVTVLNRTSSFPPPAQNCSKNEMWTTCWSSTCWEAKCGVPLGRICSRDCKVGCRCADGFARNGLECINATTCPKNETEPQSMAAAQNSNTMQRGNGTSGATLSAANATIRTDFNQTKQDCGKNEVWTSCSSSSCFEHRCGVKPSLLCTRDCRMGCKCADGFARDGTQCVNETQCITYRSGKLKGKVGKGKVSNTTAPTRAPATSSPTSAPKNPPEVLFVGPYRQTCQGNETGKCLVTKSASANEFSAIVTSIDGFDFLPGFDYKLRVRARRVQANEIEYELVTVVSKTATLQTKPGGKATTTIAAASKNECAEVICMVFCDNGYKKDEKGCEICSCLPSTEKICPDVTCDNLCPGGYQRNAIGCATCQCAPVPTTLITPPAAYNCNSATDWTLAKVAACCVPLPALGSPARALCQAGFQNGFVSLPSN